MSYISNSLVLFIAALHLYFLVLEMFFWTSPKVIKSFGLKSKEYAEETKVLAANQGLYNGFIAAGLIFSVIMGDTNTAIFFLSCVIIAGIYGWYSTKKKNIFIIQSIPAIIALSITIIKYF